jgi:hypothetical protein
MWLEGQAFHAWKAFWGPAFHDAKETWGNTYITMFRFAFGDIVHTLYNILSLASGGLGTSSTGERGIRGEPVSETEPMSELIK